MSEKLPAGWAGGLGHELILGGQRSGKSRCAEARAAAWLAQPGNEAVLLATALAGDGEMRARIDRHRADRARRVPRLLTDEVPLDLAAGWPPEHAPQRLVVVDCLTLWLTNLRMPLEGSAVDVDDERACNALAEALQAAPGPVLFVSNEIGLGVTPLTAETRAFVDALGRLHQALAALCPRVTLMVAGLEVPVKRPTP